MQDACSGAQKLYVSRVFVFEVYSIGFPISAGIPNTTLMSAHLLIAVAYLCVVLTRQDAQWKQTRLFHRGVNLIYSRSTWTFAVTDTLASSPIFQVKAEHVERGSAGNWCWHSAGLSC